MFNSPLIPQSTLVLYSDTTMASALHILELEIEISLRCQRVFRDLYQDALQLCVTL